MQGSVVAKTDWALNDTNALSGFLFNSFSFTDSSDDVSMKDSYTGVRRSFTIGAKYNY